MSLGIVRYSGYGTLQEPDGFCSLSGLKLNYTQKMESPRMVGVRSENPITKLGCFACTTSALVLNRF